MRTWLVCIVNTWEVAAMGSIASPKQLEPCNQYTLNLTISAICHYLLVRVYFPTILRYIT